MPAMQDSVAVAANSTSANVLAGLTFEFVPRNWRRAAVRVLAVTTATGVRGTFSIDQTGIVQDQLISFANRFPVIPDDQLLVHGAMPGQRMFLTFRNTTGGALTVTWKVDIEPN